MSAFDLGLIALVAAGFVVGLWKGLVRIVLGIAALAGAFFVASRFDAPLAAALKSVGGSEPTRRLAAYLLLFVAVLAAGAVAAWIARALLSAASLGGVDRMAGAALGVLAALVLAALLLLPIVSYAPGGTAMLERSRLARYVAPLADLAGAASPEELARRWRARIETLRRAWRGAGAREVVGTMPAHEDADRLAAATGS